MILPALLFGVLGLVVGTLGVHLAEAALAKRALHVPHCPYCGNELAPLQWNATFSLIVGRARCLHCQRFLRLPRLLGELFLALGWGLLVVRFGIRPRVLLAMVTMVPQAMILVTDLEAKLVPNRIMLPSIGVMLLVGTLLGPALPGMPSRRTSFGVAPGPLFCQHTRAPGGEAFFALPAHRGATDRSTDLSKKHEPQAIKII